MKVTFWVSSLFILFMGCACPEKEPPQKRPDFSKPKSQREISPVSSGVAPVTSRRSCNGCNCGK